MKSSDVLEPLGPEQREKLRRYVAAVLEHNEKTNLTAAADADEIYQRHIADGLAAVPLLKRCLGPAPTIADVGSGGGFIGIAIQVAWPEAKVTLVEAVKRKFLFLNWASVSLGIGCRVVQARAEPSLEPRPAYWGPKGGYDAVVERALAPIDEAIHVCVPLLNETGLFVAYSSDETIPEKAALLLSKLQSSLYQKESYRLPGEGKDRHLLAFRKG